MTRRLSFLAFVMTALVLAGCGGERAAKRLVVGYAQVGAESAWRTAETKSIRGEAAKRGVDLKFADGQGKQENQIKAVRSFIAQGVDVILLSPIVETGWEPVLREAAAAKIPVVVVDRKVSVPDKDLFVTRIGPDCVEEGRVAARWLAKKLGGAGNVIELLGTPGSAPAIDRKNGFHEVIAAHPKIKVIKSQSGDFRRSKGKEVMEALLKTTKSDGVKVHALYSHNDDMAIGAIQAIEDAGMKPGEDIVIVSIDGVKGAFEAMVKGTLNCTVECTPLYGPAALDAAAKAARGEKLDRWIRMPTRHFERSQAKDVIDTRQY